MELLQESRTPPLPPRSSPRRWRQSRPTLLRRRTTSSLLSASRSSSLRPCCPCAGLPGPRDTTWRGRLSCESGEEGEKRGFNRHLANFDSKRRNRHVEKLSLLNLDLSKPPTPQLQGRRRPGPRPRRRPHGPRHRRPLGHLRQDRPSLGARRQEVHRHGRRRRRRGLPRGGRRRALQPLWRGLPR